jgi:hypothetical protein
MDVERFRVDSRTPPSSPVQMQDLVVGGNLNISPQVHHHHNQKIIQNQITNQTIHPMEDFSETVTNAYDSGKKALISVGVLLAILLAGGLIGLLFEPAYYSLEPFECDNGQVISSHQYDDGYKDCTDGSDESWDTFTRDDYFSGFIIAAVIIWLADGIFIFIQGGPINTFSRIRDQFPASPTLEKGDKGKNLHNLRNICGWPPWSSSLLR